MTEETNPNTEEPKKSKPKRGRRLGRLAIALVHSTNVEGEDLDSYSIPSGQPSFRTQAQAKKYIAELAEDDKWAKALEDHQVQLVRIVGDPLTVKAETTTKVTLT